MCQITLVVRTRQRALAELEATAKHLRTNKVAGRRKNGRHDPGRTQRDHLHFVAGPSVPYDQFAIQRPGYQMPVKANHRHLITLLPAVKRPKTYFQGR